jgi:hypothetical protein
MDKNALCISLLGGQFKAVAMRRGTFENPWEPSLPVEDFTDIGQVLSEATAATRVEGKSATIVLAHPRLLDQVVEVPPVKQRTLDRLLQRRAEGMKTFAGEASWSRQAALPTRKGPAWLLHVCPKVLLDQLGRGCQQAGLQLHRVVPTTAVLAAHLKQLPIQSDEVVLLVAESGPTTTIAIGRKDGRVSLGRVIQFNWASQPERVQVDLTRSIGFAEQQSGLTVRSVWLFGSAAPEQVPALESLLKLPVKVSPVVYAPFYWAEQAGRMPEREDGNLISLETRQAPQRRRLLTVTGVLLLLLLLSAISTAVVLEYLRKNELLEMELLDAQIHTLESQRAQLERQFAELEGMEETVRIVTDERVPPLPEWFLAYLGQVVPDDLLVLQLNVTRTSNLWSVLVSGVGQPGPTNSPTPPRELTKAVAELTDRLAGGPLRMEITRAAPTEQSPATTRSGAARARTPVARAARNTEVPPNGFVIEGVIP